MGPYRRRPPTPPRVPTLYECVGGPLHGQIVAVPGAGLDLSGYVLQPPAPSSAAMPTPMLVLRPRLVWLEDLHADEPPGRDA